MQNSEFAYDDFYVVNITYGSTTLDIVFKEPKEFSDAQKAKFSEYAYLVENIYIVTVSHNSLNALFNKHNIESGGYFLQDLQKSLFALYDEQEKLDASISEMGGRVLDKSHRNFNLE